MMRATTTYQRLTSQRVAPNAINGWTVPTIWQLAPQLMGKIDARIADDSSGGRTIELNCASRL